MAGVTAMETDYPLSEGSSDSSLTTGSSVNSSLGVRAERMPCSRSGDVSVAGAGEASSERLGRGSSEFVAT